ncbi:phosphate ABC transporter permease PstA [Asticcacaulis endophyticus]|uniref:Phosphate transport system permease protein PstA n=1 Tax=Asticcacaulis endophyticus TaxID=1395890 RepID=A0A918UMG1_9CAUL|nr:phosphate ABC transporter permease PstA [Asticcacaulis endophyticus]GGZ22412.1 phosphate transport system permease protein PstA [Asticcacaulis endophyticus]
MTDSAQSSLAETRAAAQPDLKTRVAKRLKSRHAAELRFRAYGILAVSIAVLFLGILLERIIHQGYTAFVTHSITTEVYLDPNRIDPTDIMGANYDQMITEQVMAKMGVNDDEYGTTSGEYKEILSPDLGFKALEALRDNPKLLGQKISLTSPIAANADLYYKGEITRDIVEADRNVSDQQMVWMDALKTKGLVTSHFNTYLFTNTDSTQPELAGLLGAIMGSAMMLLVTAVLAIPIGVGAALFLEEFAPKNRWTALIEVNINNLAAVPSIVYGLLGLAVFINWLGMPRSSPLVGGVVLSLMALPTVIIATRSSLRAVPPSIREAALGIGASKTQAVFHHVLPLAMPGIMTGTIISLAHALGETAPLLMIGMISFVPGLPESVTSAASVLPVQIFIWENASERAFHERTAAAIIVLLVFMIIMNLAAILLRRRFERRW